MAQMMALGKRQTEAEPYCCNIKYSMFLSRLLLVDERDNKRERDGHGRPLLLCRNASHGCPKDSYRVF